MSLNRLLIVDDVPEIGSFMVSVAERSGYEARATSGAQSFKRELVCFEPTLIGMDISMPGTDGIELLRFLADNRCEAGILIVSGFDVRMLKCATLLGKSRGLRMLGTVPKPITIAALQALFEKLRQDEPLQPDQGQPSQPEITEIPMRRT